jgi:hypothetical protein
MRAERTLIIDNQAQPNGRERIIHAQSSARQGTQIHDQSNQVKNKKGGYTPEYEKRAPTASQMSQNLEIHFSNHINVG